MSWEQSFSMWSSCLNKNALRCCSFTSFCVPVEKAGGHKNWTRKFLSFLYVAVSHNFAVLSNIVSFLLPSYGENGKCTQKKYISLSPLLTQCRSEMLFFFLLPHTPSLRVCMERGRKKHSHSCTVPRVGRGKCIFSGRIVRFLHMGVRLLNKQDT